MPKKIHPIYHSFAAILVVSLGIVADAVAGILLLGDIAMDIIGVGGGESKHQAIVFCDRGLSAIAVV